MPAQNTQQWVTFGAVAALVVVILFMGSCWYRQTDASPAPTHLEKKSATQLTREVPENLQGSPEFRKQIEAQYAEAHAQGFDHPRAKIFSELRTATTINSGAGHHLMGPLVSAGASRTPEGRHLPMYRINARYSEKENSLFLNLSGRKKPAYKINQSIAAPLNEGKISKTEVTVGLERKD